jgi:hypothetical protein
MNREQKMQRFLAAQEALRKHGTVRKAAASLGMPASSFQHWMVDPMAGDPISAYVPAKGFRVNSASVLLGPEGEVRSSRVSMKPEAATQDLVAALKAAFEPIRGGSFPTFPKTAGGYDELLTVYPIPDLHFGMYAWKPESGADFDTDIAARIVESCMMQLIDQSQDSRYAVVLGLGDYFHANDRREVTMASGHKLDMDGRWMKVMSEGCKLARRIVDMVAAKHPATEVVFIQGNHDPDSSVALTVAMSLFYENHPGVTVTENANLIWHRLFGANLLAAHHGHTMTKERFVMSVASDFAKEWGKATFRHGMMGHIHHETTKEIAGMRCESFQTPSAKDSFNAGNGYRSGRSMTAITFDALDGEIGRHRVNIR